MFETILLDRALCLPAPDIAALLGGQLIAVLPKVAVQKGWIFALYPYLCTLESALSFEQQYHPHILPLAKTTLAQNQTETVAIEAWAKCEYSSILHEIEQVEILSCLTIWGKDFLKSELQQKQHLFLALLRVYRMPEMITASKNAIASNKCGKFVSLSAFGEKLCKPVQVGQILPVLDNNIFDQRKLQLEELRPPLYPELENLHHMLYALASTGLGGKELERDIRIFLGWNEQSFTHHHNFDIDWVETISVVGNSPDGHQFEKLVRKSLIKLGFTNSLNNPKASLDPSATGGAGGLDVYCDAPFSLVGECKATKHEAVPNSVSAQLIHLGNTHLGTSLFEKSVKVLFVAGSLTDPAEKAAIGNCMNVIRPETLQRLVLLKVKHQGAIDLIDLKPCLESSPFGEEADAKINQYIDKVERRVKLRADVLRAVKFLTKPNKTQFGVIEICTCYNIKFSEENLNRELDSQTAYELLIELSSPLAGYLGRITAGGINSDRFYFLRDLPIDFTLE